MKDNIETLKSLSSQEAKVLLGRLEQAKGTRNWRPPVERLIIISIREIEDRENGVRVSPPREAKGPTLRGFSVEYT